MHIQVSQQVLAWERRAPQILEEIAQSEADLICLQEVNRYGKSSCATLFYRPKGLALLEHLLKHPFGVGSAQMFRRRSSTAALQELYCAEDFFRPQLERLGYSGVFWPKACSPAEQYGYPCDGCALFYRVSRFELVGAPQGMHRGIPGAVWVSPCSLRC